MSESRAWIVVSRLVRGGDAGRPRYVLGEAHEVKLAPSSEQANVDPCWVDPKVNPADVELLYSEGPALIVVSGGTESTVQDHWAGVESVRPPATDATLKVCAPSARPEYDWGDPQAANADPSMEQTKVDAGWVEEKPTARLSGCR